MKTNRKLDTQEIIGLIKAGLTANLTVVSDNTLSGTDFFADRRDCFKEKGNRVSDIKGATALNNKDDNLILKAVAPLAHDDCHVRGELSFTGEVNGLAPANDFAASATTRNKVLNGPLCSPASEDKTPKPNEHSDPDAESNAALLDDEPVLADEAEDEGLFNPNFYRMRVDLFDNGEQDHKTRWTAKMSCDVHPDSEPEDRYVMVANFYSRARDFRSFVKGKDMWNEFYDEVEAMFHDKCKAEIDFNIKPMIAILKEESKPEFGKAQFLPLGYTACIMYQEHGKDPKVMVIYQQFMEVVELSQKFTVQKSSSRLYKIGIYRDETRAHLEPKRESPSKMVVRSRSDFARK